MKKPTTSLIEQKLKAVAFYVKAWCRDRGYRLKEDDGISMFRDDWADAVYFTIECPLTRLRESLSLNIGLLKQPVDRVLDVVGSELRRMDARFQSRIKKGPDEVVMRFKVPVYAHKPLWNATFPINDENENPEPTENEHGEIAK